MHPKNLVLAILVVLIGFSSPQLSAQDFDNYTPTVSQGPLPQDLMISSTEKYLKAKADSKREKNKRRVRKTKEKFYLQTNFVLDELLTSGQLIFNDPMTNYVKGILDNILKGNPRLRKEIKLYMVRSASINAFATDRGEIFVNVGLLAKINNEAELAFILCHEIQHYVERHNLEAFVKFKEIERGRGDYKRQKNYEKIVSKHSYSKNLEREADKKGFELFLKSGYSLNAVEKVFDLLALSHTSYSDTGFDFSFLESDYIKFNDKVKIEEVNEISELEGKDDSLSTHPSIDERRENFEKVISKEDRKKGKDFIQSKTQFDLVQKIARFDICDILISYRAYSAAFYHSYVLLKEYPKNSYAEKNIAKALYGIAQYTNKNSSDYEEEEEEDETESILQGQMQAAFYFLTKLSDKEKNMLAGRYCWKMHQKYPKDKQMELMAQDMIEDIIIFSLEKDYKNYFKKEKMTGELMTQDKSFAPYAFGDLLDNETFIEWLESGEKYRKRREKRKNEAEGESIYKRRKTAREKAEKKRKKGVTLGRDKLLVINPLYLKANGRKKDPVRLVESEARQKEFKGWIETLSEDLGLKTTVLDVKHITKKTTIGEYNEIMAINRWVDELLTNDMYMISSNYNELLPIVEKYKTTTFAYTGALVYKNRRKIGYAEILYTLFPQTMPYGVSLLATPKYDNLYFSFVFDFEENRVLHKEINYMKQKDRDGVIKSNLYWMLHQVKAKSSKK